MFRLKDVCWHQFPVGFCGTLTGTDRAVALCLTGEGGGRPKIELLSSEGNTQLEAFASWPASSSSGCHLFSTGRERVWAVYSEDHGLVSIWVRVFLISEARWLIPKLVAVGQLERRVELSRVDPVEDRAYVYMFESSPGCMLL